MNHYYLAVLVNCQLILEDDGGLGVGVQLGLDVDHCVSYIEPLIIFRYPNCRIAFIFDPSPTLAYHAANKRNTNSGDRRVTKAT